LGFFVVGFLVGFFGCFGFVFGFFFNIKSQGPEYTNGHQIILVSG